MTTAQQRQQAIANFYTQHAANVHRAVARKAAAPAATIEDACQVAWTTLLHRAGRQSANQTHTAFRAPHSPDSMQVYDVQVLAAAARAAAASVSPSVRSVAPVSADVD